MIHFRLLLCLVLGFWLDTSSRGFSQAVTVTAGLDSATMNVGQTNYLHIYAQVVPGLRTNSDRIFSWYIDVLNTNGAAAAASYSAMQKAASDNDPQTSSTGLSEGANRRGIYDSFLNLPGAGVSNTVELARIPVVGVGAGTARFLVQLGSGVASLSSDFLVAPKSGGSPYVGGIYTNAMVDLTVVDSAPCALRLRVGALVGGVFPLTFTPCPGRTHTVEYRAALADVAGWQPLPGAPHNSGSVFVTNTAALRFFRVRASSP